jgi:LacI family transcriptional regulator
MNKVPIHRILFIGNFLHLGVQEVYRGIGDYVTERNNFYLDWCHVTDANGLAAKARQLELADAYILGNIIPAGETGPLEARMERVLQRIKPGGKPYIFLLNDVKPLKLPSISINNISVGRMAADHLHLRGYPHFAFFGYSDPPWSFLRHRGFAQRLKELGCSCKIHEFPLEHLFLDPSDSMRPFGIPSELLNTLPKPCGVFAATDYMAALLIQTARYHSVRVPDQLGILGVGNEDLHHATAGMAISSLDLPIREQGYRAAGMVDRLRKGQKIANNILLEPVRVIARASTDIFMVNDPLVRRAQAYIEAHRGGRVKVGDLLKVLPSTKATLNKHFSKALNTTPSEYILRRRIEFAADLLRAGDHSVEAVAEKCGFSSRHYFGLTFKNMTGLTPGSLLFQREGRP